MLSRFAFKPKNNQSFRVLFLFFLHVLVSCEFVFLPFHDLDVSTRCELSKKTNIIRIHAKNLLLLFREISYPFTFLISRHSIKIQKSISYSSLKTVKTVTTLVSQTYRLHRHKGVITVLSCFHCLATLR
jgi:hypothetical protein